MEERIEEDDVNNSQSNIGHTPNSGVQSEAPQNGATGAEQEQVSPAKSETPDMPPAECHTAGHSGEGTQPAEQTTPTPKKKTGLLVLVVLVIATLIVGFLQSRAGDTNGKRHDGMLSVLSGFSTTDHVAVIYVEGTIEDKNDTYNQEWLLQTISDLADDNDNHGIILYINSPGGGVYQSDEVYQELLSYKEASGNPVWAYLGPMAASGGYYIACAADYIVANRNTLTGSIGVIAGQSIDLSKLMERYGITMNTFVAGRNKDMLNINVPVTPEQRRIMQSIANECYDQFTGIVAESRGLSLEAVVELADGRVYTAHQALDKGLVDQIARFESTLENFTRDYTYEAIHYYPEVEMSLYDYIIGSVRTAIQSLSGKAHQDDQILAETLKTAFPDIPFPAYYYYR